MFFVSLPFSEVFAVMTFVNVGAAVGGSVIFESKAGFWEKISRHGCY